MARTLVWVLRLLWLLLPLTTGLAAGELVDDASTPVRLVAAVGLWGLWLVGLVACLVPTTVALTVLRLLAPAPAVLGGVALVDDPGVPALLAVVTGLAVAAVAFHPQIGRAFVQGSAYGDEARFPLRARPVGARSPTGPVGRARSIRRRRSAAPRGAAMGGRHGRLRDRGGPARRPPPALPPADPPIPRVRPRGLGRSRPPRPRRDGDVQVAVGAVVRTGPGHHRGSRPDRRLTRRRRRSGLEGPETVVRRGRRPDESTTVRTAAFLCRPTLLDDAVTEAERRHQHG